MINKAKSWIQPNHAVILLFAYLCAYALYYCIMGHGGDFRIYLGASELLLKGKSIYNTWVPTSPGNAMQYSYSIFFAFILMPFSMIHYKVVIILWELISIWMLYKIIREVALSISYKHLTEGKKLLFICLSSAFIVKYAMHDLAMQQVTIFMLYCCLFGYKYCMNGSLKGPLLLATGIAIKLLPLMIVVVLMIRGKIKMAIISMLLSIALLLAPILYLGIDEYMTESIKWWNTIDPTNHEFNAGQNEAGEGVHSFSSFIPALLKEDNTSTQYPIRRNIASLSDDQVFFAINISRIVLIIIGLFFFSNKIKGFNIRVISYYLLIIPLIFPHQQKYAFLFVTPAVLLIADSLITHKGRNLITFYAASLIILILAIVLYPYSQYYKAITFSTLLLIPALMQTRNATPINP